MHHTIDRSNLGGTFEPNEILDWKHVPHHIKIKCVARMLPEWTISITEYKDGALH